MAQLFALIERLSAPYPFKHDCLVCRKPCRCGKASRVLHNMSTGQMKLIQSHPVPKKASH